jgi:acylphosphatase
VGHDGAVRARRLRVVGHVQGVFFRASTRREAQRLGCVGWVRNTPEGDVEVWCEGPADAVETLEAWVRAGGPPAATVEHVEVEDVAPEGHTRFAVVR